MDGGSPAVDMLSLKRNRVNEHSKTSISFENQKKLLRLKNYKHFNIFSLIFIISLKLFVFRSNTENWKLSNKWKLFSKEWPYKKNGT